VKDQLGSALDDAVVRQPETSKLVGYCDMQLRRMEHAGSFPRSHMPTSAPPKATSNTKKPTITGCTTTTIPNKSYEGP